MTQRPSHASMNRRAETQAAAIGHEVMLGLHDAAPWISSMAFHMGVILLAVFLVWAVAPEEPPRDLLPNVEAHVIGPVAIDKALTDAQVPDIRKRVIDRQPRVERIDPGVGIEKLKPVDDLTKIVAGTGSSGKPMPVGTEGGQTTSRNWLVLPPATAAQAKKIVYVIDASGSLVEDLGFVIAELKQALLDLSSDQQFTVIFFQREQAIEVPPRGYKRADEANKQRVANWVTLSQGNIVPGGASSPMPALQLAMQYKPDALVVLSDNITGSGRYEVDRRELLAALERLNGQHRTRIHTIQFLYPDPLQTLRQIADEHGGAHRFVSEAQLRGR